MLKTVQEYAKFIVALIGAIGATTLVAIASGGATTETWITAIVSLLTAVSVYGVPNSVEKKVAPTVSTSYDANGVPTYKTDV